MMDLKEKKMLQHYRDIIENKSFDEYDILGFLIFIRRHIVDKNSYIQEFADLVAHRERNRGIVIDCIKVAITNSYQTEDNGKRVIGYQGMNYDIWVNQWKELGVDYNISLNEDIIKEITLCVFSLAQHTKYNDQKGNSGKMSLFQGKDNSLALTTSEDNPRSLFVCFAKFGSFNFVRKLSAGFLRKPVETVRENGILRLLDEDGYIM